MEDLLTVFVSAVGREPIARSQARQLLLSAPSYNLVMDFTGVDSIGRSFADEMFRVFPLAHPEARIRCIHANEQIVALISSIERSANREAPA